MEKAEFLCLAFLKNITRANYIYCEVAQAPLVLTADGRVRLKNIKKTQLIKGHIKTVMSQVYKTYWQYCWIKTSHGSSDHRGILYYIFFIFYIHCVYNIYIVCKELQTISTADANNLLIRGSELKRSTGSSVLEGTLSL